MPDKYVVPQFIDNEDKILGPITVRQFLICLAGTLAIMIEWAILKFIFFIIAAVITAGIAGVFAFLKVNGHPFHIFFLNFLQSLTRPAIRVWNKELNDTELRRLIKEKPPAPTPERNTKARPSSTRLRDLTLTVNTGGVYNAEEDEP
jgi:hypothetical protein